MNETRLSVCATCPWRKKLQGTPHPAGWYRLANLRRLWNGLRTGNAPGMICHASDPDSTDYGSTRPVPAESKPRECAGAIQLIYTEVAVLNDCPDFNTYKRGRRFPITRTAALKWLERHAFRGTPEIVKCEDVGLPWEQRR